MANNMRRVEATYDDNDMLIEAEHTAWDCDRCRATVYRYRGQSDVSCSECGTNYNAGGQRLRDDWRGNPSTWDDNISDLDGYELQHAGDF